MSQPGLGAMLHYLGGGSQNDPDKYYGRKITDAKIEAKEHQSTEAGYDEHEMVFVEIAAEDQHITIVNHNEHNGYYGGFGLTITEDGKDE